MTRLIIWLLVLAAGCSGVPMRERTLTLDRTPALSKQSSIQAAVPVNVTNSASTEAEEFSQTGGGREVGSFADEGAPSAGISEVGTHVGRGRESGGVVMMTPLETAAESPAISTEFPAVPAITTGSLVGPNISTKSPNSLKVAPELILPLKTTAESLAPPKIASESLLPLTATESHTSPKTVPPESAASLPTSAGSSADTVGTRTGESTETAVPLPAAGERLVPLGSTEPPAPLGSPGADELSVPPGGAGSAGRSRLRPELGLAPSEKKPSSRRTGVPELEMLENPSKPRKGVLQPPEPGLAPLEKKPSSRRTGVPELEMLENPSKPRKGVLQPPEPDLAPPEKKPSSRRTGVPELEMLENPSKPRKGVLQPPEPGLAPPPAAAPAQDPAVMLPPQGTAGAGTVRPHVDAVFAGPEELAGEPQLEPDPNLAKARTSTVVGVAFVVLFVLVLGWFVFRKISDSWHHRHYRKMDFLVDGMYNL